MASPDIERGRLFTQQLSQIGEVKPEVLERVVEVKPLMRQVITGEMPFEAFDQWIDDPQHPERTALYDSTYPQLGGGTLLQAVRDVVTFDMHQEAEAKKQDALDTNKANVDKDNKKTRKDSTASRGARKNVTSRINGGTEHIPVTSELRTVTVFTKDGKEEVITVIGLRDEIDKVDESVKIVHITDRDKIRLPIIRQFLEENPHLETIQMPPCHDRYIVGPAMKELFVEHNVSFRTGRIVQAPNFDEDKAGANCLLRKELYEEGLTDPDRMLLLNAIARTSPVELKVFEEYINEQTSISTIAENNGITYKYARLMISGVAILLGEASSEKRAIEKARGIMDRVKAEKVQSEGEIFKSVESSTRQPSLDQAADF